MKVLVTGSSGLIGSALIASLRADDHDAIPLLRKKASERTPSWDPQNNRIDLTGAEPLDAVIHLAGDNIAKGRWTAQKKARIMKSRVDGTKLLFKSIAALDHKPRVVISASAVGFYGDRGEAIIDETAQRGDGFLADVCAQWEATATLPADVGIRTVHARFGVVLTPSGGALKQMLLPFRMGLGGIIGGGNQYMSWVSVNDAVGMIQHIIADNSLQGAVNMVAPNAVTNREFTKTLGQVLRRPAVLPMPAFMARLAFGEMANELLLAGVRATPEKIHGSGYKFQHPNLNAALETLLKKTN